MNFYYIQPGDKDIKFNASLDLAEIKHLHYCLLGKLEAEKQQGVISITTQELLYKLDGIIQYLQSENYG
ncbi:hypothetical protein AHMF7605_29160 [Adhaeribacter arboris]|uniref:Uncharacterized protein n=1 Tax=Adhaeribacter arboris TaxID=2072846 RepID=A0A2T2Y982_9BACT|nr:hypothetical protein [Adhaeribacter arboris]PSR51843.1 hypothetical protein AHMF7605_28405 [Adhaeribacter arboris]PSR51978.1 hypothetical protein AHMF7605_29160 [Adhaeribacter arboris]